ncbi:branched-chain amino acid aminotransferase [Luteimicrobium subarcticum]|uniref:Branched-chain-amino-acid aminotransferase n=1 Tax=Luteimicrobium subarcticum TaxID=620910 RepID=A0A2M8W6Y4_9MICO|nr:branched-chain amino acid aminotransferase [Luteimicrobium subarcticum]PJI86669.1 branched-chain amino acid aminotransferase [Luteimicrobium subarcticum]
MTLDLAVHPAPAPLADDARAAILADPGFGRYFTDHMAVARWQDGAWQDAEITALAPFSLHPSAAVLHYGQEIFEGLKAYRHADGSVHLFRPEKNARRFAQSAERLALPVLPEDDFVATVAALVEADAAWVPTPRDASHEASLYIRPFMIATEAFLGVRPSQEVTYSVIASPAGPYFAGGVQGVALWVTEQYTRASRGGTGAAKCGGNYAASLAAQAEAREHGCDQVLYLDGEEHAWLEESGTMNLFLVTDDGELVTPSLGTILEGVTRDSILDLAPDLGLRTTERRVSLAELRDDLASGRVREVFAAGTAAVITPVTAFRGRDAATGDDYEVTVGDGAPGTTALAIRTALLDVQYGRAEDTRGWLREVVPA